MSTAAVTDLPWALLDRWLIQHRPTPKKVSTSCMTDMSWENLTHDRTHLLVASSSERKHDRKSQHDDQFLVIDLDHHLVLRTASTFIKVAESTIFLQIQYNCSLGFLG